MNATTTTPDTTFRDAVAIEFGNDCTCTRCEACDLITDGPICGECEGETVWEGCYGMCCDARENAACELDAWLDANASDHGFLITGTHMGWRNLSGWKHLDASAEGDDLIDALAVDTSWIQRWNLTPATGSRATATLSHHDSPMGECYTVAALVGCATEAGEFWD